jgi:hypothetical protein
MDFIKNQATQYAAKQFGGTSAAGSHAQEADDGLGWHNLTNLAGFQQSAEDDPETDSGFMGLASKLMGGAAGGAHPTQAAAAQGANPAVLDKLLNVYEKETGSSFGGSDQEFQILTQLAEKMSGNPIGQTVMKKLIMYKMQSMF